MKRFLTSVMVLVFSAALIGCEASAEVGDDDDLDTVRTGSTYEKQTTTVREADGDVKTRTEINRNP